MTTPNVDGDWNWISPALDELASDLDKPWEDRREAFLNELGLSKASQHPVIEELLGQLDESSYVYVDGCRICVVGHIHYDGKQRK